MDGTELIRRIRAVPQYDSIAILANTQYGDPEQKNALLRLGTDDFAYKSDHYQTASCAAQTQRLTEALLSPEKTGGVRI